MVSGTPPRGIGPKALSGPEGEAALKDGTITIYSVARRAGVSIATVSRVQRGLAGVAPETRERVLEAIRELRYRPSTLGRGLARRRHGATGIVFPDLSGPFYSEVILGYEEEAVARGESLLILGTHARAQSNELVLDLAARVDGLLVMDRTVSDSVVRGLEADGVPVVLLGRLPVGPVPAVQAENVDSATRLTRHLLAEHSYERLAFVGDPALSLDATERFEGFSAAHRAAGVRVPEPVRSRFREHDGYEAAHRVLRRRERPRALVCGNDEMALGACGAAESLGLRVPEDVAVTGWDDIPLARVLPRPLTTVRQPMRALGETAARLLYGRIGGDGPAGSVVLETALVTRASCGCNATTNGRPQEVATQ